VPACLTTYHKVADSIPGTSPMTKTPAQIGIQKCEYEGIMLM